MVVTLPCRETPRHNCDFPGTFKLLGFVTADLADERVLIGGTYRDTEVQSESGTILAARVGVGCSLPQGSGVLPAQ
jgi:hypothetical protein